MPYALRRTDDGRFVAPATRHACYTARLDEAQVYPTAADALRAKNHNEELFDLFDRKPKS